MFVEITPKLSVGEFMRICLKVLLLARYSPSIQYYYTNGTLGKRPWSKDILCIISPRCKYISLFVSKYK